MARRREKLEDHRWLGPDQMRAWHGLLVTLMVGMPRIEQRFRQGIRISPEEIGVYYRDTLLPQYKAGEAIPPLDEVSPRIEEILLEQQVNALFDGWLKNLRQQGDVKVLDPALELPENAAGAGKGDA